MSSPPRLFTADQVRRHKARSDLWVIIHGSVYDVSSFVAEHPGGEGILLEHAGTDATEAFEDMGHSSGARELLKEYLVGRVVETLGDDAAETADEKPHGNGTMHLVAILASLMVVLGAVAFGVYMRSTARTA